MLRVRLSKNYIPGGIGGWNPPIAIHGTARVVAVGFAFRQNISANFCRL